MELNTIQKTGSWGSAADSLNQNFNKIDTDVEKLKNATVRNKGYFNTSSALASAFPTASVGDIAFVGTSYPYAIWKWSGSAWTNSGSTGGNESVELGNYYTKEESDGNLGYIEDNPEYIRAYTDSDGRFLWGIKTDGSIEFAKGVPTPIRNYIVEFVINRLDNVIMPEIEALKESHEQYLKESESPEWSRVIVDSEGKILWGIRQDGSVEFFKGVPTPIKKYIETLDRENDEEVERINQLVVGLLADVKVLTDTYHYISNPEWACAIVDSEERILMGIRADGSFYVPNRDMYHIESNPEWAKAVVDSEGRILFGIKSDGSVEFSKGVPTSVKNYITELDRENDEEVARINELVEGLTATFHYISNPEWISAITDSEGRILVGIKSDGSIYIPNRDLYHVESNPEYVKVFTDSEGRVLFGIKSDGTCYIPKGICEEAKKGLIELTSRIVCFEDIFSSKDNPEWLQVTTDSEGIILEGIRNDGKKFFPKQELLEKSYDIEGRTEMTLDAEGKIISYRDSNGVKHENKQHIKEVSFDKMNLSRSNGQEIAYVLEDVGFKSVFPIDYSKDGFVELPIPRVAAIVKLHVPEIPTTKTDDIEGFLEYTDKDGNYFKKPVILNAQGSSSMGYYVKNMSVDFNDDSKIKFGNWVSQDSFHIKKYYIDAFRGQCVVGYHLMEQVYQTRPLGHKKPYDYLNSNNSTLEGLGDIKKDFNTGALCHPDGFPIIIYHNDGEKDIYMGVYAWCLKKHRDNYYADKSKPTNIILDGTLNNDTIFGGNINWAAFEIRNPKDLIDIDGNEYDGENPKELSDNDALSSETKGYIERLSMANEALAANTTKEVFEQYILVDPLIDWYLVSQITFNHDGFSKNWIWCTWDGLKWTPTLYDVDSIFGSSANGTYIRRDTDQIISGPIVNYLAQLYADEIKQRYKELRDKKIFDVDNITGLLIQWIERVGYSNLKDDLELYNETPSYRESYMNEGWDVRYYIWGGSADTYDDSKTYAEGETCVYKNYSFVATKSISGVPPLSKTYSRNPIAMGYYNSPLRVRNWLEHEISFLDNKYDYYV